MISQLTLYLLGSLLWQIHGDYAWVMDQAEMAWCCNERDCGNAPAGAAEPMAGGWRVPETGQEFHWGERGLYNSRDGVTLGWCRENGGNGPRVRCLFVPGMGA